MGRRGEARKGRNSLDGKCINIDLLFCFGFWSFCIPSALALAARNGVAMWVGRLGWREGLGFHSLGCKSREHSTGCEFRMGGHGKMEKNSHGTVEVTSIYHQSVHAHLIRSTDPTQHHKATHIQPPLAETESWEGKNV